MKKVVRLNRGLVGDGSKADGLVVLGGDGPLLTGLESLALELDGGAFGLGLPLGLSVLFDAAKEALTRARVDNVLDPQVDALLDVAVLDLLVDDDADGRLGNVVDDTGLTVVDLVRHTIRLRLLSASLRVWQLSTELRGAEYPAVPPGCLPGTGRNPPAKLSIPIHSRVPVVLTPSEQHRWP